MVATIDKPRASTGWRPSVYGCSQRRKNQSVCQNKYISDIVVGPFIFGLVSAVLRARKQVTKSTSKETLKKRILSATGAEDVSGIEELLALLKKNLSADEYSPIFDKSEKASDRDAILDQKRKKEIALNRLQTIYLYSENSIPESEYLIQRKAILDDLDQITEKINQLPPEQATGETARASFAVMAKYLEDPSKIDFSRFARTVDTTIPKNFFRNIIDHMNATDGKITSVQFANGIILTFTYKKPPG